MHQAPRIQRLGWLGEILREEGEGRGGSIQLIGRDDWSRDQGTGNDV